MPERIDTILTEHPGYGWEIESPQLPELVGGRNTRSELEAELSALLRFGGAPDGAVPALHLQEYLPEAGGEQFALRIRQDQHLDARVRAAQRVRGAVSDYQQRMDMLRKLPTRKTGEILFVCAVPSDRIDVLSRQLDPGGDVFMVSVAVADQWLYTSPISNQGLSRELPGWKSLSDLGWDEGSTVQDLIRYQQATNQTLSLAV